MLTPPIQGQAVRVHSIVFAVIAGGELLGLKGIVLAVPAVATVSVLCDFFGALADCG